MRIPVTPKGRPLFDS